MKIFLAGICFLLAFIPAGNSLACVQCESRKEMDCTGDVVPCSDDATRCKTSIVDLQYEGQPRTYNVFKNCSENPHENYIYEEEIRGIEYNLKTKTCKKEGCNTKALQFPSRNTTLNGVKCPTCYVEGSFSCEPEEEPIQCTGDRTRCIYVAGTARISDDIGVRDRTAMRLQKKIDAISQHCKIYQSTINTSKTEIIIFSNKRKNKRSFFLDKVKLEEEVQS